MNIIVIEMSHPHNKYVSEQQKQWLSFKLVLNKFLNSESPLDGGPGAGVSQGEWASNMHNSWWWGLVSGLLVDRVRCVFLAIIWRSSYMIWHWHDIPDDHITRPISHSCEHPLHWFHHLLSLDTMTSVSVNVRWRMSAEIEFIQLTAPNLGVLREVFIKNIKSIKSFTPSPCQWTLFVFFSAVMRNKLHC